MIVAFSRSTEERIQSLSSPEKNLKDSFALDQYGIPLVTKQFDYQNSNQTNLIYNKEHQKVLTFFSHFSGKKDYIGLAIHDLKDNSWTN